MVARRDAAISDSLSLELTKTLLHASVKWNGSAQAHSVARVVTVGRPERPAKNEATEKHNVHKVLLRRLESYLAGQLFSCSRPALVLAQQPMTNRTNVQQCLAWPTVKVSRKVLDILQSVNSDIALNEIEFEGVCNAQSNVFRKQHSWITVMHAEHGLR